MAWFIKAFIRSSLLWFSAGIILGLAMAVHPAWVVYRPAHAHMNLAGFMTMMIFGVGYQLLPRLFGHNLKSNTLGVLHLWAANLGLLGLVGGFIARGSGASWFAIPLGAGGALYAVGALMFVVNLWRTFDAADARHSGRAKAPVRPGRELPTV